MRNMLRGVEHFTTVVTKLHTKREHLLTTKASTELVLDCEGAQNPAMYSVIEALQKELILKKLSSLEEEVAQERAEANLKASQHEFAVEEITQLLATVANLTESLTCASIENKTIRREVADLKAQVFGIVKRYVNDPNMVA